MNLVKWKDLNGGWHTGTLIPEARHETDVEIWTGSLKSKEVLRLVKESCCGTLTWVPHGLLTEWQTRDQWEQPA